MNRIEQMTAAEKSEHVSDALAAARCGCGGCCPACREHAEWMAALSDEERDDFTNLCEMGVYGV